MSTPSSEATSESPPTSRREVLKYAAGALALGLGTPVRALAAGNEDWRLYAKVTLYAGGKALHSHEIPDEVAEVLRDPRSTLVVKYTDLLDSGREVEITYSLQRVK